MKVLVITQYFFPENFRINDLVVELKKSGHDVTVLTGKPNYPKGIYYEGYTYKGNEDELWNKMRIIRVPLRERKTGSLNLIRNYLSFVFHANRKVKKMDESFDLIYVFEVSPMTVALPAIKLKKKAKIPIIMNVQDLWPENIQAITGIDNKIINYFLDKLVNYIYKNTDVILTASPVFNERIEKRVDDPKKIHYWPQYSTVYMSERNETNFFDKKNFNIVFTGNIGEAQGLEVVIEAARELYDTNIIFHLIGDGRRKKELEKLVFVNNLNEKVIFHGQVHESEIPNYLQEADMALLILKPSSVFDMTIPAKLQTYLACGCPILGCVQGISKKLIEENQLGFITEKVDSASLIKTCKEILNKEDILGTISKNASNYSKQHFNKLKIIKKLEIYMEEVVNEKF